jgi:hypothetical protein
LQNGLAESDRLKLIQFRSRDFKNSLEVDHDGERTSSGRKLLEHVDGGLISEESTGRSTGDAGSSSVVLSLHELLELSLEEIISAGKSESRSHAERKLCIVGDMLSSSNELDQVVFIDVNSVNLSSSVDADHTVGGVVADTDERKLVGDLLSVDKGTSTAFEHEEVTKLGHHEDNTVFRAGLHQDGEVSLGVRSHSDFLLDGVLRAVRSGSTDVHDEELVGRVGGIFSSEAEEAVFVACVVSHGHVGEATCVDIHDLSSISF